MTPIIQINNLTKYYGKIKGIEDVNLEVEEGDIFGFIGPNGAGKTTTIRTLLNFIFPTKGSANIFGMNIVRKSKWIKKALGYMPTEDYHYSTMNGYDYLKYCSGFYEIDNIYFEKRIKELSSFLELDLKKKIRKLSRGNKRKVSLIKSILHKPKLLIMDEPTNGLDPLMQSRVFELLKKEHQEGTTIFFSSHILSEVQKLCNRVAIIKNGGIIKTDDVQNLEKEHLKKISIEIKPSMELNSVEIDGLSGFEKRDNIVTFMYNGEMSDLLEYLVQNNIHKGIENLFIEKSSLDEIFMEYYKDKPEEKK
jgi:ABC-2 type transport system ATP-binding protein